MRIINLAKKDRKIACGKIKVGQTKKIKKIDSKFDDLKIIIATKISELIITEIKKSEKADANGKWSYNSKSFPEFV